MKKKVIYLSISLIVFSFIITSLSITSLKSEKSDVSEVSVQVFYDGNEEKMNRSADFDPDFYISDLTGGTDTYTTTSATASSGLLDAAGNLIGAGSSLIGSVGDVVGGLFGGNSTTAANTTTSAYVPTTASVFTGNTLTPVPAASQTTEVETTVQVTEAPGETVDYAATANPYTKPSSDFTAGDEDETIKWIQWIFIYTRYGLSDNGITGVLDEDTVAVVKKLQQERGLTVDGNINEDVVNKAELLYFEYTLGPSTTAQYTEPSATEAPASDTDGKQDSGNSFLTVIIILAVSWVVTVAVILTIFFLRKKKAKKDLEKDDTSATPAEKTEEKTTGVRSMSDLFEDAGKK